MSKIQPIDLTNITDTDEFMRFCSQLMGTVVDTLNGKLEFDTNLLTQSVTVSFSAVNTDTAVPHKLGKSSVQYLVSSKSAPCDLYKGSAAPTTETLYLRSTALATVTLVLF